MKWKKQVTEEYRQSMCKILKPKKSHLCFFNFHNQGWLFLLSLGGGVSWAMGLGKNSQSGSIPAKEPFFSGPSLALDILVFNLMFWEKFSQSLPPLRTGLPVKDVTLLMTTWGHQRLPSSNVVYKSSVFFASLLTWLFIMIWVHFQRSRGFGLDEYHQLSFFPGNY